MLVGFYHVEDHYYGTVNPGNIAWKSIARVVSFDNGYSWQQPELIITSNRQKPSVPEWGGVGDNSVIWDEVNKRWLCYFQDNFIMLAMSEDPLGRPGTWYKYHEGSFSQPGLQGLSTKVNGLTIAGANPSVHFNYHLNKYVIVYHGWNGNIYLSTSLNGIDWEYPSNIVAASSGRRAWYPTIIGDTDTRAGKVARLYYADIGGSSRNFLARAVIFDEVPVHKPVGWLFEKIGSFSMLGSFDSLSAGAYRILSFEGLINETPTYGYHYKETEGSFENSFRLDIDNDRPGAIGYAIRAGRNNSDDELVFTYTGSKIVLKNGTELATGLTGSKVSLTVRKIDKELTISYKNQAGEWVLIHSQAWNWSTSLIGFFTEGSPDKPAMGYINEFKLVPIVPVGIESPSLTQWFVYPNPVKDSLHIPDPAGVSRIILKSLEGKVLRDIAGAEIIFTTDLVNGVYMLEIFRSNGQREFHRVVIER
jgi:hypothetical protein